MFDISTDLKKIYLVIGLGKSGYWAAKFLKSKRLRVFVFEENNNDQLKIYKKELENLGIEVFLNMSFKFDLISPLIKDLECVILSPAIHIQDQTVIKLQEAGIKVTGEINIGWNYLKDINWVGITGTNGKTTVTHLLSHILCQNNLNAPSAGNIGIPICKYAYEQNNKNNNKDIDWIIAEISSFQIEIANKIKPKIGIWTTFTPDHLDRHKTLENYFNLKNNLLRESKIRIYNYDDKYLKKHAAKLAKGIWVSTENNNKTKKFCNYWIDKNGYIVEKGEILFKSSIFKLKGDHNIQNLLLATAAARIIGIERENIKESLKNFKQLPHRFEPVFKSQNILVINDSKATNFDSSIAGIKSLNGKQVLIAGGRIKNGDSDLWSKTILDKCEGVFLYGESAELLKKILKKNGFKENIFIYKKLKDLISDALNFLEENESKVLLFSPSCSSFDQFRNYEERGNSFKYYINQKLKK